MKNGVACCLALSRSCFVSARLSFRRAKLRCSWTECLESGQQSGLVKAGQLWPTLYVQTCVLLWLLWLMTSPQFCGCCGNLCYHTYRRLLRLPLVPLLPVLKCWVLAAGEDEETEWLYYCQRYNSLCTALYNAALKKFLYIITIDNTVFCIDWLFCWQVCLTERRYTHLTI